MPEKLKSDKSEAPGKSRLEELRSEFGKDYSPDMPPIECGRHVLDRFWEVGPALSDGAGQYPLTHVELSKYQENTGIEFSEWESVTLVRLSKEYLGESHRATKRDCEAPWQETELKIDQLLKQRSMRDSIRELAKI